MTKNCVIAAGSRFMSAADPGLMVDVVAQAKRYTPEQAKAVVELLNVVMAGPAEYKVVVIHDTLNYLNSQTLTDALWWFIENRDGIEEGEQSGIFFALRERVREGA